MNRAYRVIFNHATGVWQCVSELARSKGKSKSFKALALVSAVMASSSAMAVDYTSSATITDNPHIIAGTDTVDGHRTVVNYQNAIIGDTTTASLTVTNQNAKSTDGTLTIVSPEIKATSITLGQSSGSRGTLSVTDVAAFSTHATSPKATIAENLLVGVNGVGHVAFSQRGEIIVGKDLIAGVNAVSKGNTITLGKENESTTSWGSDNHIQVAGQTIIGDSGSATINAQKGYLISDQGIILGNKQGSQGTITSAVDIGSFITGVRTTQDLIVGNEGHGIIDLKSGSVSAGNMILGKTKAGVGSVTLDQENVEDRYIKIFADNLIVGDEGAGTFTAKNSENNGWSILTDVQNVIIANKAGSQGVLTIDNAAVDFNDTVTVGNEGKGTLIIDNNSIFHVGNIVRNPKGKATVKIDNASLIDSARSENNFFAGFDGTTPIELGAGGVLFQVDADYTDINGNAAIEPHYVRINPNARLVGNVGTAKGDLYETPRPDGGFTKTGMGTLEIDSASMGWQGDTIVSEGVLKVNGDYAMKAGDRLGITLFDFDYFDQKQNEWVDADDVIDPNADPYGKFVFNGTADISNGEFVVLTQELINNTDKSAVWKDVITAEKLVGQFKQVTDNSPLVTFYADYSDPNKVHLTLVKPEEPQTPEVPPVVEPKPEPKPVEPQPVVPTDPVEPVQPEPTPPVAPPVEETPAKPDVQPEPPKTEPQPPAEEPKQPEPKPVEPTPQPEPEPVPSVRDVNFVTAVNENNNTDTLSLASFLDGVVADGSALSDALLSDTVNFDSAKLSQAVSELEPLMMGAGNRIVHDANTQALGVIFDTDINRDRAFWAKVIGKSSTLDADDTGALGYNNDEYGVVTGIDTMLDQTRVGVAVSYVHSDADSRGRANHQLTAKSKQAIIYADHYANDATRLYGQAAIGRSDIDGERHLNTLTNSVAKSDYQANTVNAGIGAEYRIGTSDRNITPFVAFDYARVRADGYRETGAGVYDLTVDKQSFESVRSTIGAKFNQAITPKLVLTGKLAAGYESGDAASFISAGFVDHDGRFSTRSREIGRTIGIAGVGATYQLTPRAQVSATYQGQWQSGYDSQSANVGLRIAF